MDQVSLLFFEISPKENPAKLAIGRNAVGLPPALLVCKPRLSLIVDFSLIAGVAYCGPPPVCGCPKWRTFNGLKSFFYFLYNFLSIMFS